jgi:hypothetical protein
MRAIANSKPSVKHFGAACIPRRSPSSFNPVFLLLLVLVLVLGSGCVAWSVPRTTIRGNIAGRPFHISAPKDMTLGQLTLCVDTNGTVTLTLSNLVTRMNPDVITTTSEGQAKLIQATADAVVTGIQAAKP